MKDLLKSLDDLYGALAGFARTVERFVGSHRLSVDQLQEMADYLAQMRHLLGSLSEENFRPDAEREIMAIYEKLEGRIKELRNDLSAPSRGKS